MDSESKKLLEDTVALVEDNNKMLRKVRGVQKWSVFWQTLKIAVIVGITLGSFYYIEPYLDKVLNLYDSVSETQQKLNGANPVSDLLKKL